MFEKPADVSHCLLIRFIAAVPPPPLFEEKAGSQIAKAPVSALVCDLSDSAAVEATDTLEIVSSGTKNAEVLLFDLA